MNHTLNKYNDDDGVPRWSVGYWSPAAYGTECQWEHLLDFLHFGDAAAWVSYLNGGAKPVEP